MNKQHSGCAAVRPFYQVKLAHNPTAVIDLAAGAVRAISAPSKNFYRLSDMAPVTK
jgi:hypothetical protein